MKLFIDDFRECPEGWTAARTVTEAIRWLDTNFMAIEEVSLDHDIRQCAGKRCANRNETFEPVARFLACLNFVGRGDKPAPLIRIHTGNIQAGAKMADILGQFYQPYIFNPKDY